MDPLWDWMNKHFDERQQKEIRFCKIYEEHFSHGTAGHNEKLIIAKMAHMFEEIEAIIGGSAHPELMVDKIQDILGVD